MKDFSDATKEEENKEPQGWLEWLGIASSSSDIDIGEDVTSSDGTHG